MTEADIYPRLKELAEGQVYRYVVKLNEAGQPAIAPPWVVFSLSTTAEDVFSGSAEEANAVQIDVYAKTIAEARELREQALKCLASFNPGQVIKQQFPDPDTGLFRAFLEVQIID